MQKTQATKINQKPQPPFFSKREGRNPMLHLHCARNLNPEYSKTKDLIHWVTNCVYVKNE